MRWNFFLPFRKRSEQGLLRRVLGTLGPTWRAAPLRRIVQAGCFLSFLWLFFYVCFPYTARPARVWSNWLPAEVDAETGRVDAVTEQPPAEPVPRNVVLQAVDQSDGKARNLGAFRVTSSGDERLALVPAEPLSPEQLDALSASFGPWSLQEAEPGSWPSHYADDLGAKARVPAETFLAVDPLVSFSTALAARTWVRSLSFAGAIVLVCLAIPRGFCGYVCPLGTLLDLCDWMLALLRRVGSHGKGDWLRRLDRAAPWGDGLRRRCLSPFPRPGDRCVAGWWVRVKYYLLLATLVASLLGVLGAGFVAAIPVVTRGVAFLAAPLQTGAARGWHQVPPIGPGHWLSIGLFLGVLGLGLLRPRFWCKYVCPTGAIFSIANLLRLSERKVDSKCIGCGKCVEICPFDAIRGDFSTRTADCTFCQTCGGVCPARAITFVSRWSRVERRPCAAASIEAVTHLPAGEPALARRDFLATVVGAAAGTAGGVAFAAAARLRAVRLDDPSAVRPVRPPGSVPEPQFLQMCIRCGECFRACPNDALQPLGFEQGLDGLWTPQVVADWSGCEPSCSNCGQVCPTGAIRALPLKEKRAARIGLAVVNQETCLPYVGRAACQLCVDECIAAGYRAIEFVRVGTEVDAAGAPLEDSGFLAPVVLPEACVGCGLCQTRCLAINAKQKGLLKETAIRVEAGAGKEDRLMSGSYVALREEAGRQRKQRQRHIEQGSGDYLPEFVQ